jgi:hypothetical protein
MIPECNYHEILGRFPEEDFLLMNRLLEDNGYFLDEQKGIHLGSVLMEKGRAEIERVLRTRGYNGGELVGTAKMYSGHGAIYAIYDSEKIDSTQVHRCIDKFVASCE